MSSSCSICKDGSPEPIQTVLFILLPVFHFYWHLHRWVPMAESILVLAKNVYIGLPLLDFVGKRPSMRIFLRVPLCREGGRCEKVCTTRGTITPLVFLGGLYLSTFYVPTKTCHYNLLVRRKFFSSAALFSSRLRHPSVLVVFR